MYNVHIRLSSQYLSRCYDFLERGLDCKLDKPTFFFCLMFRCLIVLIVAMQGRRKGGGEGYGNTGCGVFKGGIQN